MSSKIHNVVVIGASGQVGTPIVKHLLETGFKVSALTRETSTSTFPADVKVFKTDYTASSLIQAFTGQDAIVSCVSLYGADLQKLVIDSAIKVGVKVFLPSEYGVDTARPNATEVLPLLAAKIETVNYLRSVEDKIWWISIVTGTLFDWSFEFFPNGFGGWNVPKRTVTLYDGGDVPFEATNLDQMGRAVVAVLQRPDLSKNQHVYVNSFTTTQNETLKAFEKETGDKFAIKHESVAELYDEAYRKFKAGGAEAGMARIEMIMAAFYGKGGLVNYSVNPGLWNERLGLLKENVNETVRKIVKNLG